MKKFISLLLVGMLVLGCAACASNSESTEGAADESAGEESTEQIELTVWQLKSEITDTIQNVFDKYTEEHPNVKITCDIPGGSDYDTTIKAQMASGNYPDIYMVNSYSNMQSHAESGNALDMSDEPWLDSINEAFLPSISVDGVVYGMPTETDGIGVIYNKDLFEQAGIEEMPETLTELEEVCTKLEEAGITPFAVSYKDSWTINHVFSIIQSEVLNMGEFVEAMESGEGTFNTPEIEQAFQVLDLINEHCNENPYDSDYNNACTIFANGECAMLASGLWAMTNVNKINPDINVGVFALPVSEKAEDCKLAVDNSAVWCIPPKSDHPEEAKKVLEWLASEEGCAAMADECDLYMPFDGAKLPGNIPGAWEDIQRYIDDGNVTDVAFLMYPSGFTAGDALQMYFIGDYSVEDCMNAWDESWQSCLQ